MALSQEPKLFARLSQFRSMILRQIQTLILFSAVRSATCASLATLYDPLLFRICTSPFSFLVTHGHRPLWRLKRRWTQLRNDITAFPSAFRESAFFLRCNDHPSSGQAFRRRIKFRRLRVILTVRCCLWVSGRNRDHSVHISLWRELRARLPNRLPGGWTKNRTLSSQNN